MMIKRLVHLVALLLFGLAFTSTSPAARAQWHWGPSSGQTIVVHVLDIGQGDSILVRSPEGKTALIDAGPTRDGALNALRRLGSGDSTSSR